jgi:hypothetical protein
MAIEDLGPSPCTTTIGVSSPLSSKSTEKVRRIHHLDTSNHLLLPASFPKFRVRSLKDVRTDIGGHALRIGMEIQQQAKSREIRAPSTPPSMERLSEASGWCQRQECMEHYVHSTTHPHDMETCLSVNT